MAVMLKCPTCNTKYRWNAGVETAPEFCPNEDCDWQDTRRADDDVVMPFLRSSRTTAHDRVYRQMEEGSEKRVHLAAEAAGCSPSEMSALKITNLNDRKDTEIAAMPVQNTVTQHMDAMNARGGHFGFSGGSEWAAGVADGSVTIDGKVTKGIAPRAGAKALGAIQNLHGRG